MTTDTAPARLTRKAIGGVSELRVAIDLLSRGYDVYRSMTVGGLCDLVAVHRDTEETIRIEVKTAKRFPNGRPSYGRADANKFDVLALVFSESEIEYIPNI